MGEPVVIIQPCKAGGARRISGSCAQRPERQRGVVLLVALIAMVILGLAAAAMIRSADTSGVIAGNLAFKEATTHAADSGVERAFNALQGLATADVDVANQYFRLMQTVDASGVPNTINWASVPCYDSSGGMVAISCADASSYRVQYVIDRLCTTAPAASDTVSVLTSKCIAGQPFATSTQVGGDRDSHTPSGNYGVPPVTGTLPPTIHYRVTVRVQGPRNTSSIVQATIELPYI